VDQADCSHLGGTRNPLVISWPKRIHDHGGLRSQFHHLVDIAPTMYEAAGIPSPTIVDGIAQKPLDGVSMLTLKTRTASLGYCFAWCFSFVV
jgi:arylsulfatase A-like enzyme